MTLLQDSFLYGTNAAFIAELYAKYLEDPTGVDASWANYFTSLEKDAPLILRELKGASWSATQDQIIQKALPIQITPKSLETVDRSSIIDSIRALMLIRAYRVRGHLLSDLDPLGLLKPGTHSELDPKSYGFMEEDWDRPIFIDNVLGMETATLRHIMDVVRQTYCGKIGVEFMHIQDPEQKSWIQERIESIRNQTEFTPQGKLAILERLTAAETFEKFLQIKYTGTKRFGLDGGESLIPALEQILKRGSQLGVSEVVVGMPHRGRLNVLTNIMTKPFRAIFSEFQGNLAYPEDMSGSGDVKYHLGCSADRDFDGTRVHLSLTANPSHLEAVNPVVMGKVRAKQDQMQDTTRSKSLGILMHGDAAFAGQGIIQECFAMADLKGYKVGGTIHVVVNNQIGFTTSPSYARSSPYPTDIAKGNQCPIFHVNGDDPEAVVHVSRIATEFRQKFAKDVVIDLFCYRRYGHNEGDEPAFTQPLMYQAIAKQPTTRQIYAQKLIKEGVVTLEQSEQLIKDFHKHLEEEFNIANSFKPDKADWLDGKWSGLEAPSEKENPGNTGVDLKTLKTIGAKLIDLPEGFNLNSKIDRQFKAKKAMFDTGENIDWATAEALAFGSLVSENIHVRLSGEDSGRGTFSQRHAILYDQKNEDYFIPLQHISADQGEFEVHNSLLSEYGVMGFDYGYSLAEPKALVLWEAQYGDFANGAQIMVDQFISSGESKWHRMSGLVLLLPHGYEGSGPEHSSARLERYLQMCAEDNMQVVNCTTPANYFHVLRRQIHRTYRKPLVMMTPKSFLRHKRVISSLADMGTGTAFERVIGETEKLKADQHIKRVVLCSGKIYFELLEEREAQKIDDIAIIRLEQLYPFPGKILTEILSHYPQAEMVWCQEESANMGAWSFIDRRLERVLKDIKAKHARPLYVGRTASASPATGSMKTHNKEQQQLVKDALTIGKYLDI